LRLGGNDGRLKGWLKIRTENGLAKGGDILEQVPLQGVRGMEGELLGPDEVIAVDDKPKAVLVDGGTYLMVSPAKSDSEVQWRTTPRQQLKRF
jgi:hypothetical protein